MKLKRDGRLSQGLMRSLYERGKFEETKRLKLEQKEVRLFQERRKHTPDAQRDDGPDVCYCNKP